MPLEISWLGAKEAEAVEAVGAAPVVTCEGKPVEEGATRSPFVGSAVALLGRADEPTVGRLGVASVVTGRRCILGFCAARASFQRRDLRSFVPVALNECRNFFVVAQAVQPNYKLCLCDADSELLSDLQSLASK